MALREKLGRLVLLEETEVSVLGREYRAARLGPAGLDRLVTVLCFAPSVSSQTTATKRLMDEARLAARLQNPGLVRVLGIGRVEQTFYVSTELVEGRTLGSIFERCQRESFPFAGDHALMVASRVASALEYLHGKKDDTGAKLFHGLIAPSRIVVSYDGEVKLKGLGLWPALRETDILGAEERVYLAPEQTGGGPGDSRSDVYALGQVLLQALTGRAPDGRDPRIGLSEAKVVSVSGESSPLPKLLTELLQRALGEDPASRYPSMAEMRKGIDTLLFSGDFTPTTFDLAFFMHTLFRDDMDREARAVDEARRADYREFLDEKTAQTTDPGLARPTPTPPPPVAVTVPQAAPVEAPVRAAAVVAAISAPPEVTPRLEAKPIVEPPPPRPSPAPQPDRPSVPHPEPLSAPPVETHPAPAADVAEHHVEHHAEHHVEHHVGLRDSGVRSPRETSARDASLRPTLGITPAKPAAGPRRGLWLAVAGVLAVALIGTGGWLLYSRSRAAARPPQPPPLTPEAVAAMARVKELETRLADLERQRQEAEAKAAQEAQRKVEAQAAARGRQVDPAESRRVQEEARQRARAEQEARQQQELRRLAEAKRAEEARIAAEIRAAAAAAATTTTTVPPPPSTEAAAAPPSTAPAAATTPESAPSPTSTPTQPGSIVSVNDPKLIPPFMLSGNQAVYPPLALQHGIEGTVELSALVDENGRVAEVSVVRAKPRNVGFESAAVTAVRSRRYRPGTREGVAVRVWIPIVVNFRGRR